jgi:hypothetical protein
VTPYVCFRTQESATYNLSAAAVGSHQPRTPVGAILMTSLDELRANVTAEQGVILNTISMHFAQDEDRIGM